MNSRFLAQLFARDPRKVVRFPDIPIEDAMAALQELQQTLREQKELAARPPTENAAPPLSAPPVVLPTSAEPIAAAAVSVAAPPAPAAPPAEDVFDTIGPALAGLVTQVWRARAKVIDTETGEPREEMRRVFRHIEGAYDVFSQMGLSLNDWVKQPYDAGLPVKVITFQPTPGILRDTVLEAVRPTVIWKDRLLQLGEVIVGIPTEAKSS